MKKILLSCFALAVGFAASATDLDSLCYAAAAKNAAVQAKNVQYRAERFEAAYDNALSGLEVDVDYKFAQEGENRWGVAVGQSFDWPGVYAARNRSMKYRAKAYEQLIRQDIIDKGLEVKLAAISYAKASMNHKILGDARNNFKELLDNLDRAFKRGETTILAYRKAQLQMMQIDTQLAEAENEISAAEAVLETFYPGCSDQFKGIHFSVPALRAEDEYASALDKTPGMLAIADQIEAGLNDVSVASRSALPSFKVSYNHDYEDGKHFNGFGIGITLPSWQPRKAVKAAEARFAAYIYEVRSLNMLQHAQLHADYTEALRLYKRIGSQTDLLADDYPGLLKKAYEAGILTIFEYLTEYNSYLDTISAHNDLVMRYISLEAQLSKYLAR